MDPELETATPIETTWAIEANAGRMLHQKMLEAPASYIATSRQPDDKPYQVIGSTAVIPLTGVMSKRYSWWSSGMPTVVVRNWIRQAVTDPDVDAIVLRIDSPGGTVSGTAELADDVRRAAQVKPVVAFVDDLCCSAAYWVASQASSIVATRTAIVGSIGTYMVVEDWTGWLEMRGIKVHLVATGPQKGAGADGKIDDAHLTAFQSMIGSLNAHFLTAVSSGRFDGDDIVAGEGVATGDVWVGDQAVSVGLVDRVGTFDEVVDALAENRRKGFHGARAALAFKNEIAAVLATVDDLTSQVEALAGRSAEIKSLRATKGGQMSSSRVDDLLSAAGRAVGALETLVEAVGIKDRPAPTAGEDGAEDRLRLALAIHSHTK